MANQIQTGTIMVQQLASLRPLGIESEPYSGCWESLGALESSSLDRKIKDAGWKLFFMAAERRALVPAWGGQKTLRRGVKRLLAQNSGTTFQLYRVDPHTHETVPGHPLRVDSRALAPYSTGLTNSIGGAAHPGWARRGRRNQAGQVMARLQEEMAMNWDDQVATKLDKLTGSAKENWGKLTDQDLHDIRKTRATYQQDPGNVWNHKARSRQASLGLGRERRANAEEDCLAGRAQSRQSWAQRKANGPYMQISDLTRAQRLAVPCPSCAAAPRERCCEINNGAFRREEHFARLLLAAGEEMPSRTPRTPAQPKHVAVISADRAGINRAD